MGDRCRKCGWPWNIGPDGMCKNCRALQENPDALSKKTHLGETPFEDMKQQDEPQRIGTICGHLLKNRGRTIAVLVDCGEGHQDKGDRYIKAIRERLPKVRVLSRRPGPVLTCETIMLMLD